MIFIQFIALKQISVTGTIYIKAICSFLLNCSSPQPPWMANSNCFYPDICQRVELWPWCSENNDLLRERRLVTGHRQAASYSLLNYSFLLTFFFCKFLKLFSKFLCCTICYLFVKIRAKDQEKKETTHSNFILANHHRSGFQRTSCVLMVRCIL